MVGFWLTGKHGYNRERTARTPVSAWHGICGLGGFLGAAPFFRGCQPLFPKSFQNNIQGQRNNKERQKHIEPLK